MSDQATLGRRERKKLRTRQALAATALRLFAERGFEETTIEDITEAVDVSRRTFFRHFDSKEEVALPDKSELLGRLRQALAEHPASEPPLTSAREAILALAGALSEDSMDVVVLRARLLTTEPSLRGRSLERQSVWEDVIAEALATRWRVDPATDLRSRLVATTAVAALRAAFMVWVARGAAGDFRQAAAQALDLLEQGIGNSSRRPEPLESGLS
jgi:AcrR family transcriptional regulator